MAAVPLTAAIVAGFLGVLGLLVLASRPTHRLNQAFAGLLLLRGGATLAYASVRVAPDAATALAWSHAAVWYTLPYPALVLGIAVLLFQPSGRLPRAMAWAAAAAAILLGVLHAASPQMFIAGVGSIGAFYGYHSAVALYVLTASMYAAEAYAVVQAARAASSAANERLTRRQAGLVGIGFLALLAHTGAAYVPIALARLPSLLSPGLFWMMASVGLAGLVVSIRAVPALVSAFDGAARRWMLALSVVPFATGFVDGTLGTLAARGIVLLPSYDNAVLLRRAAFGAMLALALVRYDLAGMGPRARRRLGAATQAVLVVAAALFTGGVALAMLGLTTLGIVVAPMLALGAAVLSPMPLRPAIERMMERVLLDPRSESGVAQRARAYAAALREARGPEGEARLAALRDEWGISKREHDLLAEAIRREDDVLLGRYLVESELGRGAYATALLATDPVKGERVVLKRFHAKSAAKRALAEARAWRAVRHPRIVSLLDVERVGDEVVLVLAYAEGGSARALLDRDGPLQPSRAVALTLDLLEGLAALHASGLVHRDVKAENLLLDVRGNGMLGDFGSARFLTAQVDATVTGDAVVGSLATVAPEVLRGAPASPAVDVYAAGAVLYRLLTGDHYIDFTDADAFVARDRIASEPPRLPHPRVPAALEAVVARALQKAPQSRYQSADEMRAALIAAGTPEATVQSR